jgi:hypothetical protein
MKASYFGAAALYLFLLANITGTAQEFPSGGTESNIRGAGIKATKQLNAHQNGGQSCGVCHVRQSGTPSSTGTLTSNSTYESSATAGSSSLNNQTTINGDPGEEELWGQDIWPVLGLGTINTGGGKYPIDLSTATTSPRIMTGVVYCLSCHDGNVAKGAMMTNQSFEQIAGLLPAGYGMQPIPTLLGSDGSANGNYANDHPIGPLASVASLGATSVRRYVDLNSTNNPTRLILKASQPDNKYLAFQANYGLPTVVGARTGGGFAVEPGMTSADQAYVVCTTCHTPHNMNTASADASNPIAGFTSGAFPSLFFIAAPYNPGADTANGAKASSATQFCRQCHFTGEGGSNEGSGIMAIATAF